MGKVDVAETLKTLSARLDELSSAVMERQGNISGSVSRSRISRAFAEKKNKAVEVVQTKPFTYLGGAFVGGLALGLLMSRKGRR